MARYGGITFLGASLLFLVQPLFAREILPWFGGAQSVWTTCLVCFQLLLLGGYLYAHLGRHLGISRQAFLHVALLVLSLALLPIVAEPTWKPIGGESPTWRLTGLLVTAVGGPYLLLASTAPLLHDWFGRQRPDRSPYPLYAVSNVGSLLALLAYPTLVEPLFPVSRQAALWSAAYAAFVIACAWLALGVARAGSHASPTPNMGTDERRVPSPSGSDVGIWLALSACGSGLLIALTNHITMDVAVVPFLWVLPLSLYLLTFVFAFAGLYRRSLWGSLLVLSLGAMALLWNWGFALPFAVQLMGSAAVLFTACMVCHGELARSAPGAPHLTTFYLTIAAGGALGGLLVALLAPAVFSDFWKLPLFLLASYALLIVVIHRDRGAVPEAVTLPLSSAALVSVLVIASVGFVLPTVRRDRGTVATARNFYGVLRVQDAPAGMMVSERVLLVGRIFHGGQFLDPARAREATAYFTAGSGVEMAIRRHPRRLGGETLRIGVIGLGVGTIATWGESGDSIRFYEINPAVRAFARLHFSFLEDSEADVAVVLGDGRLSLEREVADPQNQRRFDVLVVDAFSGDAVPVHLLTLESADLYLRALAEDGVLAFQVTNRHLDLAKVVRGIAAARDMEAVVISFDPAEGSGATPNTWILVTRNEQMLEQVRQYATPPDSERTVLWTDDHSGLFGILR